MKLPTLTRLARYKRFDYQPRYYDPVKEEVEARAESIRKQIRQQKSGNYQQDNTRIREAFRQNRRKDKRADLMQMAFVVFFGAAIFAYLEFGNIVLIPSLLFFAG